MVYGTMTLAPRSRRDPVEFQISKDRTLLDYRV
jgi:hypothetical protein